MHYLFGRAHGFRIACVVVVVAAVITDLLSISVLDPQLHGGGGGGQVSYGMCATTSKTQISMIDLTSLQFSRAGPVLPNSFYYQQRETDTCTGLKMAHWAGSLASPLVSALSPCCRRLLHQEIVHMHFGLAGAQLHPVTSWYFIKQPRKL